MTIKTIRNPMWDWKTDKLLVEAVPYMIDALFQWQNAEKRGDAAELENARAARDAAIAKAVGGQL